MIHSWNYYLLHPGVAYRTLKGMINPRYAIEQQWKKNMDYPLNLDNPKTFNEKLNWLKLHDHNPYYHQLVDKYRVKQIVAKKIGEEYVVKTYKVYNRVEDIDITKLPNKFVLKCTHNSGFPIICTDKKLLDICRSKECLKRDLAVDYYQYSKEWVYKGGKPRIIAEELLEDDTFENLVNYKFWCFNGEPHVMYITVKTDDIWENFYDMDFKPLPLSHGFRQYDKVIKKPECFEEMKTIARKLSEGIPHVRVDLYQIKGKVYFSEYTFYDWGGLKPIKPFEWDLQLGNWLTLPDYE